MATRIIKVSSAGFDDVNGCYEEKKENVFEMIRGDNDRIYQIRIEDTTPFGMNVWTIKQIDGNNEICIYINTNDTIIKNDNNWECIVGGKPYPLVEFISNSDDNQQKIMATKECNLTKRGKLKDCWYWVGGIMQCGEWAVLNGHTLTVYRNEKELSNPSLSIHILQIVSVTPSDYDIKMFVINRTSGEEIYFTTYSIKEKQEWMDALKLCMECMQIQVKIQCNTNIETTTTYQANIAEFAHMTHKQAQDLRVGDVIDHRNEEGYVCNAMVMDKYASNVFLHYIGYDSNRWDFCCSYDTELHRFANKDSISKRPAHRLKHLKYDDMLDVNCIKSNGWKVAIMEDFDSNSGQIEVSFYSNKSDKFWVHLDNPRECDAIGVHTGNRELRYRDFKSKLQKIPTNADIFEDSIDYKHFLKLSNVCNSYNFTILAPVKKSNEYLLIVCGYIRHIVKEMKEENNDYIIPYEIIVLLKNFTRANYFDLSKHAIFKCNVLFIENANNFKLDNGKYSDQKKETLIITKQNIDYNDFIELIYNRFGFQKYPYLQLNYYSSNNISNFDVKQFKYDTNVNAFDKYKHSIAIYFTPKLNEFDIIHSIYFTGEGMRKRGPFPLIYAGSESAIRSNKEFVIKRMLLFLGLDLNYSVLFTLNSINENHNGSMESKRIHLQIQSISHMRNCGH